MAQRYGRSRKRAHLAEIARLGEAHQREAALTRSLASKLNNLQDEVRNWDDEITRLLGAYTAFQRATPVVKTSYPLRELPIRPRLADEFKSGPVGAMVTEEYLIRDRMFRFVVLCHDEHLRMHRIVRLIEHDRRTGEYAYSVNDVMLRLGFGQRDVEYLSQQIARSFVSMHNGSTPRDWPRGEV